jgi:hypothetical protein
VLNARDWSSDDPGRAGQCLYPVGKTRKSTRRHIKKEEETEEKEGITFTVTFLDASVAKLLAAAPHW